MTDEHWRSSYDAWKCDVPSMPSQRRSVRGEVHQRIAERDKHELWAVLRSFRQVYGQDALQAVIDEAAK